MNNPNEEFEKLIAKGRIKAVSVDDDRVHQHVEAAIEELGDAISEYGRGWWAESADNAAFSLRHAGQALVLSKGYENTTLYSLRIALIHLYPNLNTRMVHSIERAKDRSTAAAEMDAKQSVSECIVFLRHAIWILGLPLDMLSQIPQGPCEREEEEEGRQPPDVDHRKTRFGLGKKPW